MPARPARYRRPLSHLAPSTLRALQLTKHIGPDMLFYHQSLAVDALLTDGAPAVVVSTSTASGKSLCYNIPVLEALAADPSACALYMFPTKALAQDQLRALQDLVAAAFAPDLEEDGGADAPQQLPVVAVYDGDTSQGERPGIRDRAQLLITNPDMLHLSILPFHGQFRRMLANLRQVSRPGWGLGSGFGMFRDKSLHDWMRIGRYVVVDEGHAYRGVFGCHTAFVLRRLRRICEREYGSSPRFIVTSATVANPAEHVEELLGLPGVVGKSSCVDVAAAHGMAGSELVPGLLLPRKWSARTGPRPAPSRSRCGTRR